MIFFTSDHHWGWLSHYPRPFQSDHEMDETLIANWNAVVRPGDTVFHLGDIARTQADLNRVLPRLNGKIILIRGNHDRADIHDYSGFHAVHDEPHVIHVNGTSLSLSHDPEACVPGMFCVHGHVHRKWRGIPNHVNVSVEAWNYEPVPASEILRHASFY